MSDSESGSIAFVAQQSTVFTRRRLQNRVAQQKFRAERQKDKASAEKRTSVAQHGASNTTIPPTTLDAMPDQDSYYHLDHSFPSQSDNTVLSPLDISYTPGQWWMSSATSLSPAPQLPHNFGTASENDATPTSSQSECMFADLTNLTEAQYRKQYLQNSTALLIGTGETEPPEPKSSISNSSIIGNPVYTAASKAVTPSYRPFATSYFSNDSLSATSLTVMDQLYHTQTSSANPQTKAPLLHVAICTRRKTMVRLLLERGATTIDERDTHGRTALHVAAQSGDEEMVALLLKNGADPEAVDNNGLDTLRVAVEHGQEEIVEMLLDAISPRQFGRRNPR